MIESFIIARTEGHTGPKQDLYRLVNLDKGVPEKLVFYKIGRQQGMNICANIVYFFTERFEKLITQPVTQKTDTICFE